jgi:hypothetical protein
VPPTRMSFIYVTSCKVAFILSFCSHRDGPEQTSSLNESQLPLRTAGLVSENISNRKAAFVVQAWQ